MYKKIYIMLLMIILCSLTGCKSEAEVDKDVKEYIEKNHHFSAKIVDREHINEGNMGNRSFKLKRTEGPPVEFSVRLEGIISPKVVDDDYKIQLKAYRTGKSFSKEYSDKLKQLHYQLTVLRERNENMEAEMISQNKLSLNDTESLKHLYSIILLLKEFQKKHFPDKETALIIKAKGGTLADDIRLKLSGISSYEQMIEELNEDVMFVNKALFERNKDGFAKLGVFINSLGYAYLNGLQSGVGDESIFCFGNQIMDGKCIGYNVRLSGSRDHYEKIYQILLEARKLNLPIHSLAIKDEKGWGTVENAENASSVEDVKELQRRSDFNQK